MEDQPKRLKPHETPHINNPNYDAEFVAKFKEANPASYDPEYLPENLRNTVEIPRIGAAAVLTSSAKLFAERNAVYKDNFRMVGRIMKAMFGDTPPELLTEEDYNRWHLFELAIVKLSRYAINYNSGGHKDSIEDLVVYFAMVASLDEEAAQRLPNNGQRTAKPVFG